MYEIHLAENIAKLRHEKKVTQEQLADFVGVTKASVSKWETGQSVPDVLLLPKLASYFDISIDRLVGYEAQLSKEQIQKIYLDLCEQFATEEFETVMKHTRELVKQYYSCYEFLNQIVVLWMNHFMLVGQEKGIGILQEAYELCEHILENSKDLELSGDATQLKAAVALLLGKPQEVIEILEEMCDPVHSFMQSEGALVGAYMQVGEMDKANQFSQISMYMHLLSLVSHATTYIQMHQGELSVCEETLRRIEAIGNAYQLEQLHSNSMALLHYHMAIVYVYHEEKEKAISQIKKYVKIVEQMMSGDELVLKTDAYFNALEVWFDKLALGSHAPRNGRFVYESMISSLASPTFEPLKEEPEFLNILQHFKEKK